MAPRTEVRARQEAQGARAARQSGKGAARQSGEQEAAAVRRQAKGKGGRDPVDDTSAKRANGVRRRRRLFWMGVVGVGVLGVAFLGAFPARTYFRQQAATARAESELDHLNGEIDGLQDQIDSLHTDAEIEQRAREDFGMARPGEEVITLLPGAPAPVEVPSGWPYSRLFAASR